MRYKNGEIPNRDLVTFNVGRNSTDGLWKHQLTPATYARHLMLLSIAFAHTGRWLSITEGWGAYRPLAAQWIAREIHGIWAAWPGTSSHGGFWESRDSMAMDYGNWAWVYEKYGANARARFYADCRKAGLTPGLIHPSRGNGYPDEPWHVIDLNPWVMPTPPKKPAAPAATTPEIEEDEMAAIKYGHRKDTSDEWMIVHPDLKHPTDKNQRGYLVTTDRKKAVAWGRTYAKGFGTYDFNVPRDEYIDIQVAAREVHDAFQRGRAGA